MASKNISLYLLLNKILTAAHVMGDVGVWDDPAFLFNGEVEEDIDIDIFDNMYNTQAENLQPTPNEKVDK